MDITPQPVRLGVFGGTFNPVHWGHLVLAQDALELFELNRVLFVPCAHPPHKTSADLAPAEHRMALLDAALEGDLRFEACDIELRRQGPSYTVDTVRELQRKFPEVEIVFIIGSDSLMELRSWKDIYALLDICRVVTIARPGAPTAEGDFGLREPWPSRIRAGIRAGHQVAISSSDIRWRIAEGMSIRYLVHPAVEMYITEHSLYRK